MHSHPSALVVGLYLLGGGFVLAVGRWAYLAYDQRPAGQVSADAPPAASATGEPSGPDPAVSHHALARANQRLLELQATLERTRGLLEKRTALLHQKHAEVEQLRGELDRSISFLFAILDDDPSSAAALDEQSSRRIEGELSALQTELEQADQLQRAQSAQLEELRSALLDAELEIADLQFTSEEELTQLAERQAAVASVTRDLVAQLGTAAVPLVTPLLRDPQPAVRAWAASTLGQIGLDAASAIPLLTELLADVDPAVRVAARRSLAAIEP
jgi:hypothetical protein